MSSKSRGGKRRRKRAGRGERGNILLNSLEQEMLHWAQHGFQPAGPTGLLPPPGVCVFVCVCVCVCVVCACVRVRVHVSTELER